MYADDLCCFYWIGYLLSLKEIIEEKRCGKE